MSRAHFLEARTDRRRRSGHSPRRVVRTVSDHSERVSKNYQGPAGLRYATYLLRPEVTPLHLDKAARFQMLVGHAGTVVDFGCGSGGLLANLQCTRRIGVEPNERPAEVARSQGIDVVGSLDELADGSADVVISNHALEHTLNPLQELRQMRKVLKPGGRVVMVLPIDDWRTQRRYRPEEPNHHLYTWSPQLMGNLLVEAGLIVDTISIMTRAYPPKANLMLGRMPAWLWELTCTAVSVVRRRRQLIVTAHTQEQA